MNVILISALETMSLVKNSFIGGFSWVDLVWLAASNVQVQMSDCSQLLDYTVQFELSGMISKKLSCERTNKNWRISNGYD